jgi:hypothetical protein
MFFISQPPRIAYVFYHVYKKIAPSLAHVFLCEKDGNNPCTTAKFSGPLGALAGARFQNCYAKMRNNLIRAGDNLGYKLRKQVNSWNYFAI